MTIVFVVTVVLNPEREEPCAVFETKEDAEEYVDNDSAYEIYEVPMWKV